MKGHDQQQIEADSPEELEEWLGVPARHLQLDLKRWWPSPARAAELLSPDNLPGLVTLDLISDQPVPMAVIDEICRHQNLRELWFLGDGLLDSHMQRLSALAGLQGLRLHFTGGLSREGYATLAESPLADTLRRLKIGFVCPAGGLAALASGRWPRLQRFELVDVPWEPEEAFALRLLPVRYRPGPHGHRVVRPSRAQLVEELGPQPRALWQAARFLDDDDLEAEISRLSLRERIGAVPLSEMSPLRLRLDELDALARPFARLLRSVGAEPDVLMKLSRMPLRLEAEHLSLDLSRSGPNPPWIDLAALFPRLSRLALEPLVLSGLKRLTFPADLQLDLSALHHLDPAQLHTTLTEIDLRPREIVVSRDLEPSRCAWLESLFQRKMEEGVLRLD